MDSSKGPFLILSPANTGRSKPSICVLQMSGFFLSKIGSIADEDTLHAGKRPALHVVSKHPKQLEQLGGTQMKIIKITDYYGDIQEVPVDDALYEEWQEMNRAEDRLRKREEYHRGNMPYSLAEVLLFDEEQTVDRIVERNWMTQRLYEGIDQLAPDQRRRILMYLENKSIAEIARSENRAFSAVHKSMTKAFNHLRRLLTE